VVGLAHHTGWSLGDLRALTLAELFDWCAAVSTLLSEGADR